MPNHAKRRQTAPNALKVGQTHFPPTLPSVGLRALGKWDLGKIWPEKAENHEISRKFAKSDPATASGRVQTGSDRLQINFGTLWAHICTISWPSGIKIMKI